MRIDKIKAGDVFKNYKELCEVLGERYKTGNSKIYQLKEWKNYFLYENQGHKFIIKEVYENPKPYHDPRIKHGLKDTKLYGVWRTMKSRCLNENYKGFKDYGGRGIKVCEEWTDKESGFINFYNWSIENGYLEGVGLSIDRIDNDGNYEPSNCRWTSQKVQVWNRRNSQYLSLTNKAFMTKPDLVEYLNFLEKIVIDLEKSPKYSNCKKSLTSRG